MKLLLDSTKSMLGTFKIWPGFDNYFFVMLNTDEFTFPVLADVLRPVDYKKISLTEISPNEIKSWVNMMNEQYEDYINFRTKPLDFKKNLCLCFLILKFRKYPAFDLLSKQLIRGQVYFGYSEEEVIDKVIKANGIDNLTIKEVRDKSYDRRLIRGLLSFYKNNVDFDSSFNLELNTNTKLYNILRIRNFYVIRGLIAGEEVI